MNGNKNYYNFPAGYSLLQTVILSNEYLRHPIRFITKSLDKFSGTYAASVGPSTKMIVTQNPGFINYVLKENHKNYQKSPFADQVAKLFGNGLLNSNGDYWLKQRRLIQPGFHKEKIHGLYENVITAIRDFVAQFPVGKEIDIYALVQQLSFSVVIKSLFNITLSPGMMEEIREIFTELQDFLMTDINQPWQKLFYPFTGKKTAISVQARRLRGIVVEIIRQRKASNEAFTDLLDMLLNSKYEDTGETMSENQITDEVLILILAGHETTGNALSWILYLLASNTEKLEKLVATFENSTIHDSLNNEYLKAVINEGMRLYPPAWMTDRIAIEDDQFGEFSFPKKTIIIPFFFGLHRDKNLWDQELKFEPGRFLTDLKLTKSKNYFPFGAGPRMCIGYNFALAEMSFFLFTFLQQFQIRVTEQVPEMKALMTLRPDKVILNISAIKS
ncbi:MAG: cytochrome P450 [Chitinophagaceae bacterium]